MVTKPVDPVERLQEEYKAWQKFHPKGFKAELAVYGETTNYLKWNCGIPGMTKTLWEGGYYQLELEFPADYPINPPRCVFTPPIFHPNVFPSGKVSLSLIEKDWVPQITVKQILLGIQILLNDPNFQEPAQVEAFVVHSQGQHLYDERIKEQTQSFTPT